MERTALSDEGSVWKGRFLAPIVISGTVLLGQDGVGPELPFRVHFVREATEADLPPDVQPTTSDWAEFFNRFKDAAFNYDEGQLEAMIGRSFNLENAQLRSEEDVFRS